MGAEITDGDIPADELQAGFQPQRAFIEQGDPGGSALGIFLNGARGLGLFASDIEASAVNLRSAGGRGEEKRG